MSVSVMARIALPTNPNCVVFAGAARRALAGSWRALLRHPAAALRRFQRESGLAAAAELAWRVRRDRRNRRIPEVTLLYVFDGPATADHLAILEEAAAISGIFDDQSSIERIPANAIAALMIDAAGTLHQLWEEREGTPLLRDLELGDSGVVIRERPAEQVVVEELVEGVEQAVALPPDLRGLDRELERMRLAFAHHHTVKIIEADEVVRPDELQFLSSVFPDELMTRMGLGTDAERSEWVEEARRALQTRLGHHDKLALVGLFFSACYSDGSLDAREMRIIGMAGEELGLTRMQVVKYLQRFW